LVDDAQLAGQAISSQLEIAEGSSSRPEDDASGYGATLLIVMPAKAGISWRPGYARVMKGGWVYLMASKPHGMLYIGVTAHLSARVDQHRRDRGSSYCRRYGIHRLVYAEQHDSIEDAIAREKAIKAWRRAWKDELIASINPTWDDLFERFA
jgi:putative endonuclease